MKYQIVNGYGNKAVISYYLDIIYNAVLSAGEDAEYIESIETADKSSVVVVSHALEVVKLKLRGFKRIILWQQGVMPEESYMRHQSSLRRSILYAIDKAALRYATKVIMVSSEMCRFYSEKNKRDYKEKTFIMPCFSAELNAESFNEEKYRSNVFTYVGGLSKWQCFDESLQLFKRIQNEIPTAKLEIYTFDPSKARATVDSYGIDDVAIETVTNEELLQRMKSIKFGFVLRMNSIVNNVATPTKLSSYLSSGVIPICTNAIRDFADVSKDMKYVVNLGSIDQMDAKDIDISEIVKLCNAEISFDAVLEEYQDLFGTYYNKDVYINELSKFIKQN